MIFETFSKFLILIAVIKGISGQDCTIDDYHCSKNQDHTMCQTVPGPECGSDHESFVFDSDQIKKILHLHNQVRQDAASGNEDKTEGGSLPTASNMCQLKWDSDLAAVAQNLADSCVFGHDCGDCRDVCDDKFPCVGQNIAMMMSSEKPEDPMPFFIDAASNWYKKEVGKFKKNAIKPFVYDSSYGHYSQLIWAKTCHVGCGGSIYKKDTWYYYQIVCNYGECGNFGNNALYESGEPCSACSGACSSDYDALCE